VNSLLSEEMPAIHALSMKTWTPAQYEAKKGAAA
jgi:stress-induced morphogen